MTAGSSSKTDGPVLGAFRITGGRTFYEAQAVEIIDQLALPHTIRWEQVDTVQGAFDAIKSMKVRARAPPPHQVGTRKGG